MMNGGIQQFNEFFSALCSGIIHDDEESCLDLPDETDQIISNELDKFSEISETFERACVILVQVQRYSDIQYEEEWPLWLEKLLVCCKSKIIKVSLPATKSFLKLI